MKKNTRKKILIFAVVIIALVVIYFYFNKKNTVTITHHQLSIEIPSDWKVFKSDNNDSHVLLAYPVDESYFISVIFEPEMDLEAFLYQNIAKQNIDNTATYTLPSYSDFKDEKSIITTIEIDGKSEKIIVFNKDDYSYYISFTPIDKFNEKIINSIKINP